MNKLIIIPIIILVLLLIDWYVWQAVKISSQNTSTQTQNIIKYLYWGFTAFSVVSILIYNFAPAHWFFKGLRTYLLVAVFIAFIPKLFAVIIILIDDIIRLFRLVFAKVSALGSSPTVTDSNLPLAEAHTPITRSEFLMKTALVVGAIPAVALTWGIISGAHDYRVWRIKLAIKDLPKSFDGLRIAQISDIHSGSFFNKTAVKGGVDMLLAEKPDMVFFTGDLVNNEAIEFHDYFDIFKKVKAPMGVFSTLGNHDYGDYFRWDSEQAKRQNLKDLMAAHKLLGWDLLNDTNRIITENGDKLAILGVQNIGIGKRFPWYGDMVKAYKGTEDIPTKLLLSHDPTHWDGEVRLKYKDVDVMFSGHTHGTQMGVPLPNGKVWSPAQYVYKQWGGHYTEGSQQLYVNRGYGYIGYPGRVGMPPEITIFELKSV